MKLFIAIFMLCLSFAAGGWAQETYKLTDGPHTVETVEEIILKDQKRKKDLPSRIYFPKAAGAFPVIVFSHGAGGSKDNYGLLGKYWASHGYVVIHPTHADSIALQRKQGEAVGDTAELLRKVTTGTDGWLNRPRDVSFVLDSFAEIERAAPALKGKLDAKRIGVGGHSYGAYTSQLIGGVMITLANETKPMSLADERVRCVLLLSAQGRNQQGLTERSWDTLKRPMMNVTGSRDRGAGGQGPDWKREPYNFSPAGDKYQLFIEDAVHGLGGIAGAQRTVNSAADNPAHRDYIKTASLAFWDAYLKQDKAALAWLKSDGLERFGKGAVTFSKK